MLLALLLGAEFWGCALSRSGGLALECTSDLACSDGNPCTINHCDTGGFCQLDVAPDGLLNKSVQVSGDCRAVVCESGVASTVYDEADHAGLASDCIAYACDEVGRAPIDKNVGDLCFDIDNKKGECVLVEEQLNCVAGPCSDDSDCQNPDNPDAPCNSYVCDVDSGDCITTPLGDYTLPVEQQAVGDCKLSLCHNGELDNSLVDASDLPVDGKVCTEDICDNGVASNPPLVLGATCSDSNDVLAHVCDGGGECVQCNTTSDCTSLPADDECQTRTCGANVANECGQSFTAVDTPLTAQADRNCKLAVCDGAGGTKQNTDSGDLPVDNNECTEDICTGSTPSNPPLPQGTMCGTIGFCNGSPTNPACVGCNSPTDCGTDSADGCLVYTCINDICGNNNPVSGTSCGDTGTDCINQDTCDGLGKCTDNDFKSNTTPCGPGIAEPICNPDLCDGNGSCLNNANANSGTFCGDTGTECNNQDSCDGAGSCTDNGPVDADTPCGDGVAEPICNPDVCDGIGNCDDNNPATMGTVCGVAGTECKVQDSCDMNGNCIDRGFELNTKPCGAGVAQPTCNPDVCEGTMDLCDNVAEAPNGTACPEETNGSCDLGVCLDGGTGGAGGGGGGGGAGGGAGGGGGMGGG